MRIRYIDKASGACYIDNCLTFPLCYVEQVYSPPFCVCLDHQMKAVVLCVRGTLSFKDSLTDMSYSPVYVEVAGVRDTYVHGVRYFTVLC